MVTDEINGKMAAIHKALDECNVEHPVFYEGEVDIHLNPKIGADWQLRGYQKRVITPGQNEKYYLAGALHRGTEKVSYVGGSSKSSLNAKRMSRSFICAGGPAAFRGTTDC